MKFFFIIFILNIMCASQAFSHGHDEHKHAISHEYDELLEHLEHKIADEKKDGRISDLESEEIGRKLAILVHDQLVEEAKLNGPPSKSLLAVEFFKHSVLDKFNFVKLGHWIFDTARRLGPAFAVAYGVTELLENGLLVFTLSNPRFAFLLPIVFGHVSDMVMIGLFTYIPETMRKIKSYQKHGGIIRGVRGYYQHLVSQRAVLPLDWDEVIYLEKLSNETVGSIDILILKNSWIEKYLSEDLKKILLPRRAALRNTQVSFSISELEQLATSSGIDLSILRLSKQDKSVYTVLLLREISCSDKGTQLLVDASLKQINQAKLSPQVVSREVHIADLYNVDSANELRLFGETPDILAQRLIWYFRGQNEELLKDKSISYKFFNEINSVINGKLNDVASTPYKDSVQSQRGFEDLYEAILELGRPIYWYKVSKAEPKRTVQRFSHEHESSCDLLKAI